MDLQRLIEDLESDLRLNASASRRTSALWDLLTRETLTLQDGDWSLPVKPLMLGRDFLVGTNGLRVYVYLYGASPMIRVNTLAKATSARVVNDVSLVDWLSSLPLLQLRLRTQTSVLTLRQITLDRKNKAIVGYDFDDQQIWLVPVRSVRYLELIAS